MKTSFYVECRAYINIKIYKAQTSNTITTLLDTVSIKEFALIPYAKLGYHMSNVCNGSSSSFAPNWKSKQDTTQVFSLLEGVYKEFDAIAN